MFSSSCVSCLANNGISCLNSSQTVIIHELKHKKFCLCEGCSTCQNCRKTVFSNIRKYNGYYYCHECNNKLSPKSIKIDCQQKLFDDLLSNNKSSKPYDTNFNYCNTFSKLLKLGSCVVILYHILFYENKI